MQYRLTMTYTIFIYIFQTWGITLFDAPYSYRETPPSKVMLGELCAEPRTKHSKDHIPVAGDTVFVNCATNPSKGGWVV